MAYLTDKEKRLLFSALTREKKVCVEVDKECCREAYEDTLESVVKNLEKKFYYDRFEKEIRAKAIDEFAEKLKKLSKGHKYVNAEDGTTINEMTSNENMEKKYAWHLSNNQCCNWFCNRLDKIAEQLKAGGENEID